MAKYRHEVLVVVVRVAGDDLEVVVKDRAREPFTGMPALPGGPLEVCETMEQAVVRHLKGLLDVSLLGHHEQLSTRSEPGRDPFERTVATTYLGLVARDIYCACLGHDVDVTNLSRVLRRRGQIVKTGHLEESGERGGRPPATWTFTRHDYEVTDPFAVLRPASRGNLTGQ